MSKDKEKKEITYHDIKKATNLSIGTISRFFNNGSISKKAKTKIEEYLKNNNDNYEPNIGAKLIRGYENCVYLIVCSVDESANINIISSIIANFKNIGIHVYVVVSSYDPKDYLNILKKTIKRKPKTLILLVPYLNDELRNYINNIEIDTYIYGDDSTNKPSLIINEQQALYKLTKSVIEQKKYKKIIYIGKNQSDPTTGKLRLQGFVDAIVDSKIDYEIFLIKNNNFDDLEKIIGEKYLDKLSSDTIVICGTHTIFKYAFFKKIKGKYSYSITDIGYTSDFDFIRQSYQFKLFIDFFQIGVILYKFSLTNSKDKVVFNNFIISKK